MEEYESEALMIPKRSDRNEGGQAKAEEAKRGRSKRKRKRGAQRRALL